MVSFHKPMVSFHMSVMGSVEVWYFYNIYIYIMQAPPNNFFATTAAKQWLREHEFNETEVAHLADLFATSAPRRSFTETNLVSEGAENLKLSLEQAYAKVAQLRDVFFKNNYIQHRPYPADGNMYFDKNKLDKLNPINLVGKGGEGEIYEIKYQSNLPIDKIRDCYKGGYDTVAFKISQKPDLTEKVESAKQELDNVNKLKKKLMTNNISIHPKLDDTIATIFTKDISDTILENYQGNAKCNGFLIDYKIDASNPHVLIFDKINRLPPHATSLLQSKPVKTYLSTPYSDTEGGEDGAVSAEVTTRQQRDLNILIDYFISQIDARQLFAILSNIHSVECYHCDLKSDNICVSQQFDNSNKKNTNVFQFKLIDFGHLVFNDGDTVEWSPGTPQYISPFFGTLNSGTISSRLAANDLWAMVLTNIEFAFGIKYWSMWLDPLFKPRKPNLWSFPSFVQLKMLYTNATEYIKPDTEKVPKPVIDIVVTLFNKLFKVCDSSEEASVYTADKFIAHITSLFPSYGNYQTYSIETDAGLLYDDPYRILDSHRGGTKKNKKRGKKTKKTKKYKKRSKKYKVKKSKKPKKSKRKTCIKR
jgi:serine/threonine protein kinase